MWPCLGLRAATTCNRQVACHSGATTESVKLEHYPFLGICLPERRDNTGENQRGTDQQQSGVKGTTGGNPDWAHHASLRASAATTGEAASLRVAIPCAPQ